MDGWTQYNDNPDVVRERLRRTPPGAWYVFESFAADGALAIGIAKGTPIANLVLVNVIYEGLSEGVANAAARGLAHWYRDQGRTIASF